MIVAGERVAKFVSDALGFALFPPYTAMGIERDGLIVAGVLLNCFEGADLHMTAAGRGWNRGFLAEVGRYVYGQLAYERMTVQTEHPEIVELAGAGGASRGARAAAGCRLTPRLLRADGASGEAGRLRALCFG